MTRIAGVPDALGAAAATISASAGSLDLAAARIAAAPLPEMPPGIAAAVGDALSQVAARLRDAARRAHADGVDLKRRGAWLEVAGTTFEVASAAAFGRTLLTFPLDALDLASRRRAVALGKIWGRYETRVVPYVDEVGDGTEAAALRKLFFFAREEPRLKSYDRYRFVVAKAGDLDAYEGASRVPFAAVREFAGPWLGLVGVAGGVFEMIHPDDSGWKGDVDRVSGAATAVGSGLSGYTTLVGLEAATAAIPGVDLIAGGLLLGSAGWEMYTHRKAIARALVGGGGYLRHHPVILAGPAGMAAEQVWDHRQQLAHAAVSSAAWGAHRVEDAAAPAVSAYHEGGKLLGKIGL